jgi:hydrogenase-4 component B
LNHSLFKPLLFLSAGSVIHATHTREIDSLGGLARVMPFTFLGFIAGAWAICGLPIMNGFLSELCLYLGLFRAALAEDLAPRLLGALAIAGLALMGALAVACFVRALGAVFLGMGRSDRTVEAREGPAAMTAVILVLALSCLALGVAPLAVAPLIDAALQGWTREAQAISELAPLAEVGLAVLGVAVLASLCGLLVRRQSGPRAYRETAPVAAASVGTWDCGYADPSSPRLQYTASSLGEMLAGLFRWAIRLQEKRPRPLPAFPPSERYESQPSEPLLDRCLIPLSRRWADRCSRLRILQRGNVQIYLVYILVTLVLLIVWAMLGPRGAP